MIGNFVYDSILFNKTLKTFKLDFDENELKYIENKKTLTKLLVFYYP